MDSVVGLDGKKINIFIYQVMVETRTKADEKETIKN